MAVKESLGDRTQQVVLTKTIPVGHRVLIFRDRNVGIL